MKKRIVDVCMTVLLLCLMAYQVTGEQAHEWIGIGMTVLVIIHQILNRRWYGAIFKGRYTAYRFLSMIVNVLLLLSFALTAFSGMSMSGHAVPFLYGVMDVSLARKIHLSMSHWSFVLMGLHLGMHVPLMAAKWKLSDKKKSLISAIFCCIAGIGLFLFLRNGMPDYLFFRVLFAFLDYEKAAALVFLENILMLLFWAFTGAQAALFFRKTNGKENEKKNPLLPAVFVMAAVILGLVLNMLFPSGNGQGFGGGGWSAPKETNTTDTAKEDAANAAPEGQAGQASDTSVQQDPAERVSADQTGITAQGGHPSPCPSLPSWRNMTSRENGSYLSAPTAAEGSDRA